MESKIEWEELNEYTMRLFVIGGWIVSHHSKSSWSSPNGGVSVSVSESMVFIPDADHAWLEVQNGD